MVQIDKEDLFWKNLRLSLSENVCSTQSIPPQNVSGRVKSRLNDKISQLQNFGSRSIETFRFAAKDEERSGSLESHTI